MFQFYNLIPSLDEQWQSPGHGYRVATRIVLWQSGDALKVPLTALFRQGGGWALFKVENGTAGSGYNPRSMVTFYRKLLAAALLGVLTGCASMPEQPVATAQNVDLSRFMGDWYVIASIPTFLEKDIYNAVESYERNDDGTIATTFRFRKGGFNGPVKSYHPKGFVRDDPSNAIWGMRFIWPFKAEYLIMWVNGDYTQTVIGRSARDYVWIMAREPQIPEAQYREIVEFIAGEGYDVSELRKVPQRWPETGS